MFNASVLDDNFGPVFVPEKIDDLEKVTVPRSLQTLNVETAPALRVYFKSANAGLLLPQINHDVLPILWVVAPNGAIRFALEEVVSIHDRAFLYPLSRKFQVPDGHVKLGHPSLLDNDCRGRFGGEIRFDPEFGEHKWVISNKSGRYGFCPSREEHQLVNVADKFREFGILLDLYYIKSVRR